MEVNKNPVIEELKRDVLNLSRRADELSRALREAEQCLNPDFIGPTMKHKHAVHERITKVLNGS